MALWARKLFRVLPGWASAQNSSERAEEANGSLPRFSRKSIAILRLLKTGEQHRRMGVFGKSIAIMGEFSKLFRESRIGEWESSQVLHERVLRVLKTLPREQKRRMGVFSGFGERVLPFCDFSKLESSIGEWEYSERVLALWASSQNSSERAEEANGSFLRFWRKSIAILRLLKTGEQHRRMGVFGKSIGIMGEFSKLFRESRLGKWESSQILPKEYFATLWELLRVLITLPREQNRRMRVFSGFDGRVLPLGEFPKLESSIGEWESSERVLALWASSQNSSERAEYANASLLRFCRKSIATGRVLKTLRIQQKRRIAQNSSERAEEANGSLPRFSRKSIAILRLLKTGEQHRRMGVFGKSIGIMGEFSKLFRESRRGEWESSKVFTEEYCHSATSQNWRAA